MLNLYLDIGPLQEKEYTGISQVTVKIAEAMLADTSIKPHFMYSNHVIPSDIVASLVKHRNGAFFRYHFERNDFSFDSLQYGEFKDGEFAAALFPNTKTCRGFFPIEAQIIHDLSTLLTPEYHTQDTIRHHAYSLVKDLKSNDITFCVSEATRSDLTNYFKLPLDITKVCYLGGSEDSGVSVSHIEMERPYIVVLGTLEPRKNLRLLFKMLKKHPEILNVYDIAVIGRVGWGESVVETLSEYGLEKAYSQGCLKFLGFLPEIEKNHLIKNAELMLYPSKFEGFGLPVLEALSFGVPVVTSISSSLPEVGGPVAYYCDPDDEDSLWMALLSASSDLAADRQKVREKCLEQAEKFSWSSCYSVIKNGIELAYQNKFGKSK